MSRFVIFGASGDLTSRKLIPALYRLYLQQRLPAGTRIVGCSRSEFSDEAWRAQLAESTKTFAGDEFRARRRGRSSHRRSATAVWTSATPSTFANCQTT